uniref:HTH cro/C1-type domain-containing protein n=1 Tax=Streptomyces sp. NBC_00093 TaxID=2975649 RepID=A0AAU2AHR6_9ACTN
MVDEEYDSFEGMNQHGFYVFVRTMHEKFGKPKYKVIVKQAKEEDPQSTLSTSTISDVLRGKSFPRIETARWLGLGIGGEDVARDFETAWRHAKTNHYQDSLAGAMRAAGKAQESNQDDDFLWNFLPRRSIKLVITAFVAALAAILAALVPLLIQH